MRIDFEKLIQESGEKTLDMLGWSSGTADHTIKRYRDWETDRKSVV